MSDTAKRILSAIVLILTVTACISSGVQASLVLVLVAGFFILDEIFCNFFRSKRFSKQYFVASFIFLIPFISFEFLFVSNMVQNIFVNVGLLLNILLLVFLFYSDMESPLLPNIAKRYPFISGVYSLVSMMALASIFHKENWTYYLIVLLFVTYGMDSGAWFFGKNFGRHKLWPSVSPNKTIEGFLGGALTSGFLGGITWHLSFDKMSVTLFVFFCFLGALSQIGDLIQSKMKRIFQIKDSGHIIPGHGGVYDRLDSLIYLAPFFATTIKIFNE